MICPEGLEIIDSGKEWGIISICPENMLTTKVRNKEGIMNKIEINSGGDLLVLGGVQAPYDKLRSRYSV